MNLDTRYRELLSEERIWYYKDFNFDGDYLKNATEFLNDFFRHAGKAPLAEFNCYSPDDYERDFRNKHMVSTYILGHLIANRIYDINQLNIESPIWTEFAYVWYLICLFHDAGYGLEKNLQERDSLRAVRIMNNIANRRQLSKADLIMSRFKGRQNIHSSIWFGHNKFAIKSKRYLHFLHEYVRENNVEKEIEKEVVITKYYRKHKFITFSNGLRYRYPTYTSSLIKSYFEYRISDIQNGCIDHGIVGGYIFFDTMIKNYIYCYNEVNQAGHCQFEDFLYNGKWYSIEQFSLFGYIADCIMSHNIWNGRGNEDAYRKFGLDCLIGSNYAKINKNRNPYLFLLALCDTLEPLKLFKGNIWNEEGILRQIDFSFGDGVLIMSSVNKEIYNTYCHKLAGLDDWIDIKVQFNEKRNEIKLVF